MPVTGYGWRTSSDGSPRGLVLQPLARAVMQSLVKEHGKAYEEMRSYFNDITANTLDLIKALKADAAELKRRETAAEALAFELAQENKRLIDPLALVSPPFGVAYSLTMIHITSHHL
jgi:hypothetical protein